MNRPHNTHHMYDLCKKHMHSYVLAETVDGNKVDGIITGVDEEYVYMAVPNHVQRSDERFAPGFGYGFPGYGYPGYGYGYPGYVPPAGRFRRLVLPLTALTALSLLPWY
ncbi:hypothetical protein GH741_11855 [Aquibacillus halophilus]|uniref:Uncharacterized protein n=1 Tax=Aquibacillus halophilus TaxID=930132 RepID=A0A6A8DCG7_9BACI|nr:hypothetical protein [Aquibacillus halophilus]MRH43373.1 hypothetical protein [Aquibacillus halophilus]